jgi:hypothetical protein
MNALERTLDDELIRLLDRVAASIPEGAVDSAAASDTLKARLDDAESRLAEIRAAMLTDYGRWRRALDDLENLWALACWRSVAAQEPVEQTAALAA